jgi:hypothetical protein
MIVVPSQRREAKKLAPDYDQEPRNPRPDLSPASVVSIRVELRTQERDQAPAPIPATWHESRDNPPRPTLVEAGPQPSAAEPFPVQAAERAAAAYAFHRTQFEPATQAQRPKLDVRA